MADVKTPTVAGSNEIADRVAAAIFAQYIADGDGAQIALDQMTDGTQRMYRAAAIAAIGAYEAALKAVGLAIVPLEPNEDAYGGLTQLGDLWRNMNSTKVYRAMVAAANLIECHPSTDDAAMKQCVADEGIALATTSKDLS